MISGDKVKRVNGNIQGVRQNILEQLQEIYLQKIPKDILISEEILKVISHISFSLNREVSVYISRNGIVVDVSLGDSNTVGLQHFNSKRRESGLSRVRCIHTHPSGDGRLSEIDISALRLLKLDIMASVAVAGGEPGNVFISYLLPKHVGASQDFVIEGPLKPKEVYHKNIMSTIKTLDRAFDEMRDKETNLFEERAILVGVQSKEDDELVFESLNELGQLADTAGVKSIEQVLQKRERTDNRYFIGEGKAKEISLKRQLNQANVVIFNHELSPVQQRNLENLIGCKVIDRTELILDIFAQRAKTREGKLQVELAQLNYLLPRLIGVGVSMSRLGGGIGTRGPGETKLEMDRRRIRKRIADLQEEIKKIQKLRNIQRSNRQSVPLPMVSLVGYTNAGKSTLLNSLTGAEVLAEDKLFATLDPTTRRLTLPSGREVLLTDTVGFIDKIPHHLIAAFKATLEEVVEADVLLHVVDIHHPLMEQQIESVEQVLTSLGAAGKPAIMVLNKADQLNEIEVNALKNKYPSSCAISAINRQGLEELCTILEGFLPQKQVKVKLVFSYSEVNNIGTVRRYGKVLKEEYSEDGLVVELEIDEINLARLKKKINFGECHND